MKKILISLRWFLSMILIVGVVTACGTSNSNENDIIELPSIDSNATAGVKFIYSTLELELDLVNGEVEVDQFCIKMNDFYEGATDGSLAHCKESKVIDWLYNSVNESEKLREHFSHIDKTEYKSLRYNVNSTKMTISQEDKVIVSLKNLYVELILTDEDDKETTKLYISDKNYSLNEGIIPSEIKIKHSPSFEYSWT